MRVLNIFDTSKCESFMWSYTYQLRDKSKNLENNVTLKDIRVLFSIQSNPYLDPKSGSFFHL